MKEPSAETLTITDGPAELFASSPVVSMVFEQILAAVNRGELLPGERISDAAIASEYGVSRTPVREALQRLREIGVIEASASRFTRVAVVTPLQTAQNYIVWQALFAAVVDEVVPNAPEQLADQLDHDAAAFEEARSELNPNTLATINYQFFARIQVLCTNPALHRAMTSVVHVIRLGAQHLPEYIDLDALTKAHQTMARAVRERDVSIAHESLALLRSIRVPQE